jgi:hypothetical protein
MKFDVKLDASQHPMPAPSDGKALVYIVSQSDEHIPVDGKWVGANEPGAYLFAPTDAGGLSRSRK